MFSTIHTNLGHGTAKLNTPVGTQGRAETSNMPKTARGSEDVSSLRG